MKIFKLILFLFCISCSTKPVDVIIENEESNLQYKYYSGIKDGYNVLIDKLNEEDTIRGYKAYYNYSKDTTIVNIIDTVKVNYDASYRINIYWEDKFLSDLKCDKKLKINSKQLTFIFCFNEVIDFLKTKKDKDVQFAHYYDILNEISTEKSRFYKFNKDLLVSDLVKEISFEIEDSFSDLEISKVTIGDVYTSFSKGIKHYIIDKKNDTIAYFEFTKWVN